MSYLTIAAICLVTYIGTVVYLYSARMLGQYLFGMVVFALIPYVNMLVAALLLIKCLRFLYNDVLNAFKDTPSC